jgi:hypothetical protein
MKSFVNSFDLFAALDQELTDNRKGVLFHLTLEFYEWYRAKELNAQWSTLGDAVRDFIGFSEELHLEVQAPPGGSEEQAVHIAHVDVRPLTMEIGESAELVAEMDDGAWEGGMDLDLDLESTPEYRTLVYDEIEVQTRVCPPAQAEKCASLTSVNLYEPRNPFKVYVRTRARDRGGNNTVRAAVICSCDGPNNVLLRELITPQGALKPVVYSDAELTLTVMMADIDVAPKVYAVSPTKMVLEKFSHNLSQFLLLQHFPDTQALAFIARKLSGLFRRLASRGFIEVDVKPENVVVLCSDPSPSCKTVGDVRLIDFDPYWTKRYPTISGVEGIENLPKQGYLTICAFAMYYTFYYFMKRKGKTGEPFRFLGKQMLPIAQWYFDKVTQTDLGGKVFDALMKQHFDEAAQHYFDRSYIGVDVVQLVANDLGL